MRVCNRLEREVESGACMLRPMMHRSSFITVVDGIRNLLVYPTTWLFKYTLAGRRYQYDYYVGDKICEAMVEGDYTIPYYAT